MSFQQQNKNTNVFPSPPDSWTTAITKISWRKHTENFTPNKWIFSDKNSDIIHISAQNIDCGYSLEPSRRGGSYKYPQCMSLNRNKKNNVYPKPPSFNK